MKRLPLIVVAAALATAGCASLNALKGPYARNFLDPNGPRYSGGQRKPPAADSEDTFQVLSFNIHFAEHAAEAVSFLRDHGLDQSDVLLLQEMDLDGVMLIAEGLDMEYVYYPAALHPHHGDLFGVAILARWPITNDAKVLLPPLSASDDARKIAMAATVEIRGIPIGFVNVHLQSGLLPIGVGDQLQVITACVFDHRCPQGTKAFALPEHLVVAGDFNTPRRTHRRVMLEVLEERGLTRVRGIEATHRLGLQLDHIFASRGLEAEGGRAIRLRGAHQGVSDHYPVVGRFEHR